MYSASWFRSELRGPRGGLLTDTNDSCAFFRGVVEYTLADFIVQVSTVVVCFDCIPLWVMGICMERVEMRTYPLDWSEILVESIELLSERADGLT